MSLQELPLRKRAAMFGLLLATILIPLMVYAPKAAVGEAYYFWYSVLPPILAIAMVLLTGRLLLSLIAGVVVGAFTVSITSDAHLLSTSLHYFTAPVLDTWNLQVLAFIPLTMCMISIIVVSGGFLAVVRALKRWAKGPKSTQFCTFLAGLILFFDDYANTMIVGSGMRPLSDHHRVSRHKLAFLVDATSAPIAGIALMSTWIGYEIGLFREVGTSLGLQLDGFTMFLDALQFRFYCIMMIGFVVINVLLGRDYGPMSRAQKFAYQKPPQGIEHNGTATPHLSTVLIPIGLVFATMLGGLWLDGGGGALWLENPLNFFSIGAWQQVLVAVENSVTVLLYAAILGFVAAVLCGFATGAQLDDITKGVRGGLRISALPIAILVLAWALKTACDGLGTGNYLVGTLSSSLTPWMYPGLLFLVAGLTAFATGTSWGTMAILIPTAIPLAYQLDGGSYGLITMICLGAVLDGAIFGDHCSPISDTTIMSSTAAECDHLEHVHTQLPYAVTVSFFALVLGYIPAAMGLWGTGYSIVLALGASAAVLLLLGTGADSMLNKSPLARLVGFVTSKRGQPSPNKEQIPGAKPQPQKF